MKTRLSHTSVIPRIPSEGRGGIGFWLGNATESSREMDATLAPRDEEAGVHVAAALSPEPVSICSPSDVASICLAAAAAVMALLLGYGLVTFPEMLLQASAGRCTIFPAFHPSVSVMLRCKCNNLQCESGFVDCNISTTILVYTDWRLCCGGQHTWLLYAF